jgi:hypothetical protein
VQYRFLSITGWSTVGSVVPCLACCSSPLPSRWPLCMLQASIEQDDMEILRLERLIRPLARQLPDLKERMDEHYQKLRAAEIDHNEKRAARRRVEYLYWKQEHDNLEIDIKVGERTFCMLDIAVEDESEESCPVCVVRPSGPPSS